MHFDWWNIFYGKDKNIFEYLKTRYFALMATIKYEL